jgi:hypothetical protein
MATASAGLGTTRPLITKDNQVLLMSRALAIAAFDPCGLVSKYSFNVMVNLSLKAELNHDQIF